VQLNDQYSSPNIVIGDQIEKNEMGGAGLWGHRRGVLVCGCMLSMRMCVRCTCLCDHIT
jgi:hypothetical protein